MASERRTRADTARAGSGRGARPGLPEGGRVELPQGSGRRLFVLGKGEASVMSGKNTWRRVTLAHAA
ncbi:hypothetical protein WS68_07000 [Burkholderia sp. TSV86]|nr:hypothetical protein WS68_07000 [Burkholderia sp. TSV86]